MLEDKLEMLYENFVSEMHKKYFGSLYYFINWIHRNLKKHKHGVKNPLDIGQYNQAAWFDTKDKNWKAFYLYNEQHPGYVFFISDSILYNKVIIHRFYEPHKNYEEQCGFNESIQWPKILWSLDYIKDYSDEDIPINKNSWTPDPKRRTLKFFLKGWKEVLNSKVSPVYDSLTHKSDGSSYVSSPQIAFKEQINFFFWLNVVITGISESCKEDLKEIDKYIKEIEK